MAVGFVTLTPCPSEWEYTKHPKYSAQFIINKIHVALTELRNLDENSIIAKISDTRPLHELMFSELAPQGHPYFAGNYRGATGFPCLSVDVKIGKNSGTPYPFVLKAMDLHADKYTKAILALQASQKAGKIPDKLTLVYNLALLVAAMMEHFYRIHPYANGNGHAGRYLAWAAFGSFGIWARSSSLSRRPPGMDVALEEFRAGDKDPLINLLISWLK